MDSFLADMNVYVRQKRLLTRVILFTVNYCLFANGDYCITFSGKDNNVMLEFLVEERFSDEIMELGLTHF